MRTISSIAVAASLLAVPQASTAQVAAAHPWTAVASTGAIDEAALGLYQINVSGQLLYKAASVSLNPIDAHYNVTNTFDNNLNPEQPGWSVLELGFFDAYPTVGTSVRAILYRVDPCTGTFSIVCAATSADVGAGCVTCNATNLGPIDFSEYLYYVRVTVDRAVATEQPRAHSLRLY